MKKIKDFNSFVSEDITNENLDVLNENIWTELFSNAASMSSMEQVYYWLGVSIDAIAIGVIGRTIGSVATSGVIELLKNYKLGQRGKEFADKIKELGQKGASLFKNKQHDENFVEEVNDELVGYQDIIDKLNDGELGEEGKNLAKKVTNAKEAAETAE